MSRKIKLFLFAMVLAVVPLYAGANGPFQNDPGDGSGGGGCSTSCAKPCPDGSWSGIGCLANQCAHCTCTGSPVRANPYCS